MLPTIDISLIGILVAVWTVLKTAIGWVMHGLNFISQKALAFLIGSKLWATAAFLACYVGLVALSATVVQTVISFAFNVLAPSVGFSALSKSIDFLSCFVDMGEITSLLSFVLTSFIAFKSAVANLLWFQSLFVKFQGLLQSWKT